MPAFSKLAVAAALVGGAVAPAPCYRGCDKDLAEIAMDAAACVAAGAECVFDAGADADADGYEPCGVDKCPDEKAAIVVAIIAGDPSNQPLNADGSSNLAAPTTQAMHGCMLQCLMPDATTCSTEIAGLSADDGAGLAAVRRSNQSASVS
jgi:hypothetical protein